MKFAINNIHYFRAVSFLWGFLFILFFRYLLNTLYPFWSGHVTLSFFAYALILPAWIAYILFQRQYTRSKRWKASVIAVTVVNSFIFLFLLQGFGGSAYLYAHPMAFSIQVLLHFFLFFSVLTLLNKYRISLVFGILPGFLLAEFEPGTMFHIISCTFILILGIVKAQKPENKNPNRFRMIPLRKNIDLVRYALFGISLLGILDDFRFRFFFVLSLLAAGPLLQHIILKIDKRKHHIKQGTIFLSVFFFLLSVGYQKIAFSYWAAIGFSLLTIWEALYFKRRFDGDDRRDQLLVGGVLIFVMFSQSLTYEWMILISGLFIITVQIRILIYVYKSYRKILSIIFLASLISWTFGIVLKYQDSFKRQFFSVSISKKHHPAPSIYWPLYYSDLYESLITNVYPEEVLKSIDLKGFPINIEFSNPSGADVTWSISWQDKKSKKNIYLYNLDNMKAYQTRNGIESMEKFHEEHSGLFFLSTQDLPPSDIILKNTPELDFSNIDKEVQGVFYNFGIKLALWYEKQGNYQDALLIYDELLLNHQENELFLKAAAANGILGQLDRQIELMEFAIKSADAGKHNLSLIMELYYYKNQFELSKKTAEKLIKVDPENQLSYLKWIFRILKEQGNRHSWQKFYYRVKKIRIKDNKNLESSKEALLMDIQDTLTANPAGYEIIERERKRQENIQLPK